MGGRVLKLSPLFMIDLLDAAIDSQANPLLSSFRGGYSDPGKEGE
jgi:hypothetical protein